MVIDGCDDDLVRDLFTLRHVQNGGFLETIRASLHIVVTCWFRDILLQLTAEIT